MSTGIAGRNRIICTIAPKNLLPGVSAGPFIRAVVLATGQGKVGIAGVDGTVVELGDRQICVVIVPRIATVRCAPDPAVVPHDQLIPRPRHAVLVYMNAVGRI